MTNKASGQVELDMWEYIDREMHGTKWKGNKYVNNGINL